MLSAKCISDIDIIVDITVDISNILITSNALHSMRGAEQQNPPASFSLLTLHSDYAVLLLP